MTPRLPPVGVLRERARYVYRFGIVPRLLLLFGLAGAHAGARLLGRLRYRRQRDVFESQRTELRARLGVDAQHADRLLERAVQLGVSEDVDLRSLTRARRGRPERVIEIRGREHLDAALAGGRGAVLCSGHFFGHFTFFSALGLLGYRPNIVGFPQTIGRERGDQWYPERRHRRLERAGCRLLRMGAGNFGVAVTARNALARNEVVTIEIDHSVSRPVVEAELFGAPARLAGGPALLAEASGAPLLWFSIRREAGWRQVAVVEPPFEATDTAAATRRLVELLQASIAADPASWAPWLFPRRFIWLDDGRPDA